MSDITATTVTADGVAVNHPARVKGMYFVRAYCRFCCSQDGSSARLF